MKSGRNAFGVVVGSWLVAGLAGALAWIMLWTAGDWSFIRSFFLGVFLTVFLGLIISAVMTRALPPSGAETTPTKTPGEPAVRSDRPAPTVAAKEDRISQAGTAPAPETVAAPAVVSDAPPPPTATPAAPGTSQQKDDLKRIGGIGPVLEKKLHSAGIYRFEQIATMTPAEAGMIEEKLSFKGRMLRDDWFGQAKILAAGGETEFSRKKR